MRAVVLALCATACGRSHWVSHACEWSTSPPRDAIAYLTDTSVVVRRVDGEHRLDYAGCLAGAKDAIKEVAALEDGWSAFVYGYRVRGGNFIESGSVEGDVRAKTSRVFDVSMISRGLRHAHVTAAARGSWIASDVKRTNRARVTAGAS